MDVIPAIDIRGGRAVRLTEGDFDREKVYDHDPVALAHRHRQAGASRVHVVDLDAARGGGDNRVLVERVVAESGISVQVAGGIRDAEAVAHWLDAGATAVVMGTTAVSAPEDFAAIAQAHPGKLLAALDVRGESAQVSGWSTGSGDPWQDVLRRWNDLPLAGVILTAVDRDGTLMGPDLDLLASAVPVSNHRITYSGGVARLAELRALASAGAAAVILGKSIYEGRIDLATALRTD
jgi:phosphoribosylformimino-5-aminoimidazole carboxamide ribotide isomerase